LLRRLGALFVERFDLQASVEDARRLVEAARAGRRVVFFPEGTFRSGAPAHREAHPSPRLDWSAAIHLLQAARAEMLWMCGEADLSEERVEAAHVPPTSVLREDNLEELATRKEELVFKPAHGFAGRGLLRPTDVGRSRLRRLLRQGEGYVAQQRVPRSELCVEQEKLWADLRVWAYRGERLLISGRGSRHADRLDLRPPGGWLPTYARGEEPSVRRAVDG
jgi:hypothetical protein